MISETFHIGISVPTFDQLTHYNLKLIFNARLFVDYLLRLLVKHLLLVVDVRFRFNLYQVSIRFLYEDFGLI